MGEIGMTLDPKDFASSFKGFMETMSAQQVDEEPQFLRKLREHFGESPKKFPVITEEFNRYDHANLHVAIEDFAKQPGHGSTVVGFLSEMAAFHAPTLAELVSPGSSSLYGRAAPQEGPVQYINLYLEEGRSLACVALGLFLMSDEDKKFAVLLRPGDMSMMKQHMCVDVMSKEREDAEGFLAVLRKAIRNKNVYRNHVLSIEKGDHRTGLEIKFHSLPKVKHEDIILPDGLLKRIERQTIRFGQFSEALLQAKRHLKRGLLLYGPPGTGKTLTAMYLASEMKDRTILLLTGRSLELIQQSCGLARALQPAMIVLEDVDLVAEERTRQQGCATPLLFELLNEMDGMSEDIDVIFLLTTNRADILEPALAARPGRVDQAFEIPLPDEVCRRRLFDLYSNGLDVKVDDVDSFMRRSKGASAAFMCEMLRKAALFAAEDGLPIVVKDKHLDEALRELVISGGAITRSLLGFEESPGEE